jgi:glucose-1-phosphate thymidylyltransferase
MESINSITKGLLLVGGSGSRLYPATSAVNKHLLPVYDKPLVYYSLTNLLLCDVREIALVCRPQDRENYQLLLGDGSSFGVSIDYFEQRTNDGIPAAIQEAKDFFELSPLVVALGDNLFHGSGLSRVFQQLAEPVEGCKILVREVPDPERFGVLFINEDESPRTIVEKPTIPESNLAITGMYFFDASLTAKLKKLSKSARGEFEVADLLSLYLRDSKLLYDRLPRGTMWLDTGTVDSLSDASSFVRSTQNHTGQLIGSPEEVAWRKGWISDHQLSQSLHNANSKYSELLSRNVASRSTNNKKVPNFLEKL